MRRSAGFTAAVCALLAWAAPAAPLARGDVYVALGSSYAAGPGIVPVVQGSPARCARSQLNYPHQLAQWRGLQLIDASCSGATTAHLLGPWNELPPQLDALTADARLVTVTIGGNDLAYMGSLMGASACAAAAPCNAVKQPTEQDYAALGQRLARIAAEVHRRSPEAQLVFVDYFTVLPSQGGCAAAPLQAADASSLRAIAARLAQLTATAAREGGALLLPLAALSTDHGVCAAQPWLNGFQRPPGDVPFAAYHPTSAGMAAAASALDALLPRQH